ncbi:hypothetical protein C7T79_02215 [Xanthomonas oryzae pv. oryzicola]|nr:hypothetical protein C7T79_02215 [Xanthomonas oryzae pv. oryzicola]
MPPHSEQIVSRICGALFRGSLATAYGPSVRRRATSAVYRTGQTVAFAPRNAHWNIKEIRVGSR